MSNLTTRKIVLGLLMTLVLAFGVQGIADAQTLSVSGDGTADSADSGIQFIESTQSTSRRSFNIAVNGAKNGQNISIAYTTNTNPGTVVIPTSPAGASGNTTQISFIAPDPDSDLTQAERDAWTWTGTITVNYNVIAYGQFTVTVTHGGSPAWTGDEPDPITAYLVRDRVASRFSTFTGTPATLQKNSQRSAIDISLATTAWTKVDFSISAGSGTLYLGATGSYVSGDKLYPTFTTGSTSFSTYTNGSGAVSVQFEATADTTATVKAQIPGATSSDGTHEVTVFYNNSVRIERISGNNQFGPANSNTLAAEDRQQLSNPLVVQILDGTRGVGQKQGKVEFTVTAPTGASDGTLRYFSRAFFADETGSEQDTKSVTVYTDSQGYAKVYLVLGTTAVPHTVTATMDGESVTFAATATQAINTGPDYEIDTSDSTSTPQVGARYGNPSSPLSMTVNVDDTNRNNASNVQVHFEVTGGRIYLAPSALDLARPNYQTALSTVTNGSGNAIVYVEANSGSTAIVTARIAGNYNDSGRHVVTYFYDNVNLEYVSGNNEEGVKGTQLADPFVVQVKDGVNGRPVPGQVVKFSVASSTISESSDIARMLVPIAGTTVFVKTLGGDELSDDSDGNNRPDDTPYTVVATPISPNRDTLIFVKTDSQGEAKVHLQLGTGDDNHRVTVGTPASSDSEIFTATGHTASDAASIEISDGNNQSAAANQTLTEALVITVKDLTGQIVRDVTVRFTTDSGAISNPSKSKGDPGNNPTPIVIGSLRGISVDTDRTGRASVRYNVGNIAGEKMIRATITAYDGETRRVTFNINGGGTSQPSRPSGPSEPSNTITITLSSTTGEPGDEIDVRVTSDPSGESVNINSGELSDSDFSGLSGTTPFTRTLILPDEEDRYTFSATSPTLTRDLATVTVESEEVALGRLSIVAVGAPLNGQQTVRITVRDSDGVLAVGAVSVTLRGTGIDRIVPTTNGLGATTIPVPNTVAVSADGYTRDTLTLTGTGQQEAADDEEDDEEEEEETLTASEPDSIEITGPSARSGTVNEELERALIVRVLDDDDNGIEDARVFYRVIEGRGRISDGSRGGRRIGVVTDDDGYARVNFTPTDGGTHTIRVNTDDLSATVEFTITTGSAPSASGARDAGTGGTPGTGGTSGASIIPVVHVVAASRPPMLWVDGGAIYGLVGADAQRFAPSVDNALNIAVGGSKVYWTEQTGENSGTINSADLDGSDVTELVSVRSVPMGIAVDTAGRKLYWTASSGKIKRANLNGSGRENVMLDLPSPMDLALAGGNAYWTQGNGSVRFVNLRGQKVVRNITPIGSDTPGSLAISGGKVYWTEKTAASAGTINSANLNGTDVRELTSVRSVPMGIAVDTARSKLYWTASSGKIKQANLNGSGAKNVVSGLGSPGDMVLSNSITAPAGAGSSAGSGTTASDSKYDVNGDGSVNNADSDAITVAIAAGATDAKYDVNGDGTVNVFDLVEIIANRDPGAAGAPTLFGMKMSAVQIDHLQEQIDLLIATNDRSPAAMRVLVYLQQLLVTARPEKTQLLANYPNPFNPETWIPYELATDTDVRLTIYNTQGVVIRTLQFGHQSAGYYTGRDRAAYWDGRNALGEQVASGLYFYQLETDEMSLMRKMVILK